MRIAGLFGHPASAERGDGFVAVVVADVVGVWRFLIVVKAIFAAGGGDARGIFDAHAPALKVEIVNAVVAKLAGAPVPKPMPIIRQEIVAIAALGGRALPEI